MLAVGVMMSGGSLNIQIYRCHKGRGVVDWVCVNDTLVAICSFIDKPSENHWQWIFCFKGTGWILKL